MQAGRLRHRITIQAPSGSNWVDFATVWAAKEQVVGREAFELADQLLQDEVLIRFRVRYRNDITHKMRVSWDSKYYDIQRIEELDNTRQEMILLCLEVPE
jgi:SPP1 family predicted phage head-tail adaptor